MRTLQGYSYSVPSSLCIGLIVAVFILFSHFDDFIKFPGSTSKYTSVRLMELQSYKITNFDHQRVVVPWSSGSITSTNNQTVCIGKFWLLILFSFLYSQNKCNRQFYNSNIFNDQLETS